MVNKNALTLSFVVMGLVIASPAFAQTRDAFGPSLPLQFDRYGARHWYVYGYYGPFDPSMPSPTVKAVSNRSEHRTYMSGSAAEPKARIVRQ